MNVQENPRPHTHTGMSIFNSKAAINIDHINASGDDDEEYEEHEQDADHEQPSPEANSLALLHQPPTPTHAHGKGLSFNFESPPDLDDTPSPRHHGQKKPKIFAADTPFACRDDPAANNNNSRNTMLSSGVFDMNAPTTTASVDRQLPPRNDAAPVSVALTGTTSSSSTPVSMFSRVGSGQQQDAQPSDLVLGVPPQRLPIILSAQQGDHSAPGQRQHVSTHAASTFTQTSATNPFATDTFADFTFAKQPQRVQTPPLSADIVPNTQMPHLADTNTPTPTQHTVNDDMPQQIPNIVDTQTVDICKTVDTITPEDEKTCIHAHTRDDSVDGENTSAGAGAGAGNGACHIESDTDTDEDVLDECLREHMLPIAGLEDFIKNRIEYMDNQRQTSLTVANTLAQQITVEDKRLTFLLRCNHDVHTSYQNLVQEIVDALVTFEHIPVAANSWAYIPRDLFKTQSKAHKTRCANLLFAGLVCICGVVATATFSRSCETLFF